MSYLKRLKSGCTSNTGPHPKGGPGHPTSPAPTPMCSPGAIICQSGLSTLLIDGTVNAVNRTQYVHCSNDHFSEHNISSCSLSSFGKA